MFLVALAAGAVEIRLWEPFPGFSPLGAAATLIGAWEVLRDASGESSRPPCGSPERNPGGWAAGANRAHLSTWGGERKGGPLLTRDPLF